MPLHACARALPCQYVLGWLSLCVGVYPPLILVREHGHRGHIGRLEKVAGMVRPHHLHLGLCLHVSAWGGAAGPGPLAPAAYAVLAQALHQKRHLDARHRPRRPDQHPRRPPSCCPT
jgi:hypothetical protein